jgi:hypothetical protein
MLNSRVIMAVLVTEIHAAALNIALDLVRGAP